MGSIIYLFRIYLKYLDHRVWWLLVFSLLIAIADGIGIAMLMPMLQSLEMGNDHNDESILFIVTDFLGITNSLSGILTFMLLIFFAKAIMKFSAGMYQAKLHKDLYGRLTTNMYDAILNTDYQYFTSRNSGYFITVMSGHINKMINSFNIFAHVTTSIIMASSYVILASALSWQVALTSIIMGGIILFALSFISRKIKQISKYISTQEKKNSQTAIQALFAFKYLVSTASHKQIQKLYKISIDTITQLNYKTLVLNSFTRSLQELLTITLLICLIIVEIILMKQEIASVLVILLLFYRAVNQTLSTQNSFQNLVASVGMVESVDQEFEMLQTHKTISGIQLVDTNLNKGIIKLENVSFKYINDSHDILHNINIEIQPNTTIAIVGPSGAGKTTLVDLITGILIPSKGEVKFNNTPINEYSKDSWRSKIGYVSQDITIFDDTIYNNVSLYDNKSNHTRVTKAAKQANILEFVEKLEKGLQTSIGDRGVRLSGGQRQRLFIARELYKQPDLLILDEATSALDASSEKIIQEAIENLKGKITVIIIAHRLATIKTADTIFVMDKGRVIDQGSYNELISKTDSLFSKMVKMQTL